MNMFLLLKHRSPSALGWESWAEEPHIGYARTPPRSGPNNVQFWQQDSANIKWIPSIFFSQKKENLASTEFKNYPETWASPLQKAHSYHEKGEQRTKYWEEEKAVKF